MIKLSAAAFALGLLAVTAPTLARSPLSLNDVSVLIPVQDEENEEVWQDLRPDVTPPEAAVGKEKEESKGSEVEEPGAEDSGDVENKEVWRNLETGETPPPGE